MAFEKIVPVLYTRDLRATTAFYEKVVGLSISALETYPGIVFLEKDGIEIMLSEPNAHISFTNPIFTGSFYFRTNDVDGLWDRISNQAKIVYEIENFAYGMREFAIYDNNGYLLQFGQEIE